MRAAIILGIITNCLALDVEAANWVDQARRLQKIGSVLLDAYPIAEPSRPGQTINLRFDSTVLPTVNATVGGKEEKFPTPPLHAVPTLEFTSGTPLPVNPTVHFSAGVLPPGGSQLVGLDAELSQWLIGAALSKSGEMEWLGPDFQMFGSLGAQTTRAELRGSISSEQGTDRFKSETDLFYASSGLIWTPTSLWANVTLSRKQSKSTFHIAEDQTTLTLTDSLSGTAWPIVTQVAAGWRYGSHLSIAIGEVWIPERALMPRLSVAFGYVL